MFHIMRRKKYGQYTTGFLTGDGEKQKALFIGRRILELMKRVQDFEAEYRLDLRTLRFIVSDRPVMDKDGIAGRSILVGYKVTSFEKEPAFRARWRNLAAAKPTPKAEAPKAGKTAAGAVGYTVKGEPEKKSGDN